jgi:ElaB/YqjD/DUF883 family membrane-anchored ribosome-binding protein
MSHENKGYWDEISKLTAERDELSSLLEEVLDSWQVGESIDEAKQIYDKARQLLSKDTRLFKRIESIDEAKQIYDKARQLLLKDRG